MPGIKNQKDPGADFLTNFSLHRQTTASDTPPPSFPETIDLSASPSATRNAIRVVPVRTSGADTIAFALYVRFPNAPAAIASTWLLHKSTAAVDTLAVVEFDGLFAAEYKLLVTHSTGADTFDIYVAANA